MVVFTTIPSFQATGITIASLQLADFEIVLFSSQLLYYVYRVIFASSNAVNLLLMN